MVAGKESGIRDFFKMVREIRVWSYVGGSDSIGREKTDDVR